MPGRIPGTEVRLHAGLFVVEPKGHPKSWSPRSIHFWKTPKPMRTFSSPWAGALLALLAAVSVRSATAADDFALKAGDRVVFYGDSITDQRLYTTFAETYVVTRFPKRKIDFVHSGWGGDRVTGGGGGGIDLRLERDVVAYRPTVMTIMLGMNDGSYRAFDQGIFDTYANGYRKIVKTVKEKLPGIRITAIQPSPFDDVAQPPRFEGGYNAVLVKYGEFVAKLAAEEHLNVADLNGPVVAALVKAVATDAEGAKKIIPDRVHPGPAGHLLMAGCLLKSWNAPATVSAVELDAAGKKVAAAQAATVSEATFGGTLSWVQSDEALPMPVNLADSAVALAVRSSDFMESLNRQMLKVTGLTADKYRLEIDGREVGTFGRADLASGVELAGLDTPMARQAAEVHGLTLKHNNLHFQRWRQIQVPLANASAPRTRKAVAELMAAIDEEEAGVVAEQRAAAQPKPHRFQLTPL